MGRTEYQRWRSEHRAWTDGYEDEACRGQGDARRERQTADKSRHARTRVFERTVYRRRNAICLRDRAEVTVDEVRKRPAAATEEQEELVEKLRDCEEVRERLEDDNELLRNSSKTFGDLAERLRDKLDSDSK
jgi:hypothetical protein